mmetsp:Transcript_40106/g.52792  ORF Transcript_40106/g.52792 Transcript_40106/m.52792 type:complete len:476 (-) Transcript_40106:347-1774(-)
MASDAPAFSMSGRLVEPKYETPGPGSYGSDNFINKISPRAVGFDSGMKRRPAPYSPFASSGHLVKLVADDEDAPGPGAYSPSMHSVTHTASKFSFASPSSTLRNGSFSPERFPSSKTLPPGPGAYKKSGFEAKGPKQPFGLKTSPRQPETHMVPAPSDYNVLPTNRMQNSGKGFVVKSATRFDHDKSASMPGPGSYELARSRDNVGASPSRYTMRSAPGGRLIMKHPESPGPGAHEIKSAIQPSPPKKGQTAKRFENPDDGKPGAGDYSPSVANRPQSPIYSMRPKTVPAKMESVRSEFPGPGNYDQENFTISSQLSSKRMNSTFGSQDRFNKSATIPPGPGAYVPRNDFNSRKPSPPKNTMAPRTKGPSRQFASMYASKGISIRAADNPGPGAYTPADNQVSRRPLSHKMGISLKKKDKETTPGPGAYDTRPKNTGPKYSMSLKLKKAKKQEVWESIYFPNRTYMGASSKLGKA